MAFQVTEVQKALKGAGCVNQKWPRSSPVIWPHGW